MKESTLNLRARVDRFALAVILALLVVVVGIVAPSTASASQRSSSTTSSDDLRAAADAIMNLDYHAFIALKSSSVRNPAFNWTDDGCSTVFTIPVRSLFNKPCQMHDFGYRNYGTHSPNGPHLAPN